jgi:hypothetical protein
MITPDELPLTFDAPINKENVIKFLCDMHATISDVLNHKGKNSIGFTVVVYPSTINIEPAEGVMHTGGALGPDLAYTFSVFEVRHDDKPDSQNSAARRV